MKALPPSVKDFVSMESKLFDKVITIGLDISRHEYIINDNALK